MTLRSTANGEHEAVLLAVLGHVGDAVREAGAGRARGHRLPVDPHLAGVGGARAEDRLRELGAPGADQAGERHDLAPAHGERDVLELAVAGEPLDLERDVAGLAALAREELLERAPHHELHERLGVEVVRRAGLHVLAVAHDRDAVGEAEDLLEPVRDVDDADALAA